MMGKPMQAIAALGRPAGPMRREWGRVCGVFHDGEGFSGVGVAIALLITLSLVFTGAQVYQVQSASAEVQEVADAAALAADNVVAEYYLVARFCDALVLSLSLTGVIVMGVGVAALCTPLTAPVGARLVSAGERVLRSRDAFAQKAATGLDKLQKALPLLAAAAAARVAAANAGSMGTGFIGVAFLVPFEGKPVEAGRQGAADSLIEAVEGSRDGLARDGDAAEDAARRANEAKERAYQADCGADPGYCMFERAATLAGLSGTQNPRFSSVDTWNFSAALLRARAYYPQRAAIEHPDGDSVDARANSALRQRFYWYAVEKMGEGYVNETDDSFDAYFPLLPKNTSEMRQTSLYTDGGYPITMTEDGQLQMHAWGECPLGQEVVGYGSIADMEYGGYTTCPACQFTAASMGKVAAATTSTASGFEHYYRIVAEEAENYARARDDFQHKADQVKGTARTLFDEALDALRDMASQRIEVAPCGRSGAVAVVACLDSRPASTGFASRFVVGGGSLGAHVAISAATLVSDSPEQGRTVISSALDGLRQSTGSHLVGALDGVMDVWSAVLFAYADGQQRIGEGLDEVKSKLSFLSESGLAVWGSREFDGMMADLGLQPAELDAPKPVLVNTGNVLKADSSAFSVRLLGLKQAAASLSGGDVLSGAVGAGERWALGQIEAHSGKVTIAEMEIFGDGGPSIPITITVPDSLTQGAQGLVEGIAERLRGVAASVTGVRQWR